MPDPLVSIVIPAYNPAPFLLETIASASAQTHSHTEIVLVNDGTDRADGLAILEQASRLVKHLSGTTESRSGRGAQYGVSRGAG